MRLFSADENGIPEPEFAIDLSVWRKSLVEVPLDYFERAYDAACDGWNFANEFKQFTPDLIRDAYREIVQEARRSRNDAYASYYASNRCKHTWRFDPEDKDSPSGDFYLGFNVCEKCGRVQPVPNMATPLRQKEGIAKQLLRFMDQHMVAAQGVNFNQGEENR